LQKVPAVYHTEINDVLLAALSITLANWSNRDNIIIGLEGHGREQLVTTIDTARTVGWFTSVYPLLTEVKPGMQDADVIKQVKEQLRKVPDKGIGFGVLRYINKESSLQRQSCWNIGFNYLGQSDNVINKSRWFNMAPEPAGTAVSDDTRQSERLFINCVIQNGELLIEWGYSSKHYKEETIQHLATAYRQHLLALIQHCMLNEKTIAAYTPSDFGLAKEISWPELDAFLQQPVNGRSRGENIQSICRLSALQEGMLFHSLYGNASSAYTMQISYNLTGLHVTCFKKSWVYVLKQHSVLRSGFYSRHFTIPVQCVHREVSMPLEELDFRQMQEQDKLQAALDREEADRTKTFDFEQPPLMRITIIQLNDAQWRMIWTYHHLLFDGWSGPVLMGKFMEVYEALVNNHPVPEHPEDRYEEYIRYIGKRDAGEEETYWRNYLEGVKQGTLLPFINTGSARTKHENYRGREETLVLSEAVVTQLEQCAQHYHLTINTFFQAVWAYLLFRYTGNNDVLYGVTVSGRPEDLPNVEQRVGMYINTLPLRTVIREDQKIIDWLQQLQQDQVRSRTFQYTSLNNIQSWTGIRGDLFDSIVVFENYPVSKLLESGKVSLEAEIVTSHEQNNYPLSISVLSFEGITVFFKYNAGIMQQQDILKLAVHFNEVLQLIIRDPEKTLADLEAREPGKQPSEKINLMHADLFDFEPVTGNGI
jgi:non-ribosomal peptide synthase protein (TIGR01720 family)